MSAGENGGRENESSLVKLYMDLTGQSESQARSVFMYRCADGAEGCEPPVKDDLDRYRTSPPTSRPPEQHNGSNASRRHPTKHSESL